MTGYVDLHSHVLPGIDDGPEDLEESLAMLRAAAESGVSTIVATPHLHPEFPNVDVREIAARCEQLRDEIRAREIEIELVCGAETSLLWALEAGEQELKLATYGQLGTDLLIETPAVNVVGLATLLYELRAQGFRITLAHPERSREFQRDHALLAELADQGVLLQLNADSLLADPRRSETSRLARRLCEESLATVVASDGHRASAWRPVTRLADAAREAPALVGADLTHWLTVQAPAAIVAGDRLPPRPAVQQTRARRWLPGRR